MQHLAAAQIAKVSNIGMCEQQVGRAGVDLANAIDIAIGRRLHRNVRRLRQAVQYSAYRSALSDDTRHSAGSSTGADCGTQRVVQQRWLQRCIDCMQVAPQRNVSMQEHPAAQQRAHERNAFGRRVQRAGLGPQAQRKTRHRTGSIGAGGRHRYACCPAQTAYFNATSTILPPTRARAGEPPESDGIAPVTDAVGADAASDGAETTAGRTPANSGCIFSILAPYIGL